MPRLKITLLFVPFVLFVLCLPFLDRMVLWLLFLLSSICALYGLSLLAVPLTVAQVQPKATIQLPLLPPSSEPGLPHVPQTVNELRSLLSPDEFEVFSAAVIVALGQGYRFKSHTGGSGDQGADTLLENKHRLVIVVQSKFNADDNKVGSPKMREFAGTILYYHAAYGYFVTTTLFSSDAHDVYQGNVQIHIIDGRMLESYLKWRNREIALAWREILEQIALQSKS